jgi:hypothetical protein
VRSPLGALAALVLSAVIVGLLAPAASRADGSHLSVDFAAARPTTYDHVTGDGGAYGNVVNSLQGGDFACDDIVVFFAAISVDSAEPDEHTVELDFGFSASRPVPTASASSTSCRPRPTPATQPMSPTATRQSRS